MSKQYPVSLLFFIAGMGRYIQFYLDPGQSSRMSGVLILISGFVFLTGLVSGQITALRYNVSAHLNHQKRGK